MYLRLCLRFALLEVALALALAALVPPEPRRPPQAECAVSLLLQSAPSALVLVALDGWADDDFLGQLAADVPVSVVTDPGRARALLGKGAVGGLAQGLVLVAAPRMMNVSHEYERLATNTIFWFVVPDPLPATLPAALEPRLMRGRGAHAWPAKTLVAVTSSTTGETRLYAGKPALNLPGAEVSRWSAAEAASGGCRRGAPFVKPACKSWQPLAAGSVPTAYVHQDPEIMVWNGRVRFLLGILRRSHRFATRTHTLSDGIWPEALEAFFECRMYIRFSPHPLEPGGWHGSSLMAVFPWGASSLVVMVPAGMGRGRSPLLRLADAFRPPMWMATAAATVATAFVLWLCLPRAGAAAAALQVLAPLLAQPPPAEVSGRPRALVGMWLLIAVVVAAAYQGQVLSSLTAPDPAAQINSMAELNDSGLTVYARFDMLSPENAVADMISKKVRFLFNVSLADLTLSIAEHRNAAAIFDGQSVPDMAADVRAKLHFFRVTRGGGLRSAMSTSKGSPMEVPMRKLLGRLRAGGILEMLGSTWQRGGGRPRGADGGPSALTVHHVLPAFLVLAAGLLAASGVFVAELLLAHRTRAAALHHRGTVVDTPRTRY